jgi:hypothetical protein
LSRFGENGESREGQVLRQFADLGKTSYLLAILTGSSDHPLRQKFVVNFGKHTDPQIQAWLKTVPTPAPHDDLRPNIPTKENAA